MGKVKTRFLGMEEIEKKQKQEQKKKATQKKTKAPGKHKGGEQVKMVEADLEALAKMEKAQKLASEVVQPTAEEEKKTKKITKARVRGKKYMKAKKNLPNDAKYNLEKAIDLLKKNKFAKFDESVELHLNTVKEGLKGETQLPHPTGKTVRVKIVDDKLLDQIEQGKIDFDILVTHPSFMPKLAKLAKILGPKGLMPNPKTGTISDKPEDVAKKFSQGALRWKSEPKAPLIHLMVGKISYDPKKLTENAQALIKSVGKQNLKSIYIKTTMSPAIQLDIKV